MGSTDPLRGATPAGFARLATLMTGVAMVFACGSDGEEDVVPDAAAISLEGTAPAAVRGLPSVVTLDPEEPTDVDPPADTAVVDQYAMQFYPNLSVVRVGQAVEFRNSEDVPHNVRVSHIERDSTLFNVVTPQGDPYHYTFVEPGDYEVTCDIHVGMTSFILVTPAPYAVTADDDGSYSFSDLPAGTYTRTVWSVDPAQRHVDEVEIGSGDAGGP